MPSLHSVGRQLDTRLQRFATKQWQPAPPVMLQRSSYVMPASSADWRAVHRRAVAERARARTGLAQVRPLQRELASLGQQAESFTEQAAPGWTPLRSRPDWTELRQSILDDAPGTMTRADVERLVEVVGKRDAGHMRAQVLAPIHEVAADLSDTSESWHAALVGAELAEALASFNSRVRTSLPQPGELDAQLRSQAETLHDHQRAIRAAIGDGVADAVTARCKELLAWAAGEALETTVTLAAALARARATTRSRWVLGPPALAAADLIRGLLLGQALAHRAAWAQLEGLSSRREWREAAALPYPTRWQPPAPVDMSELWAHGAAHAGQILTVEGVVGPVVNTHVRRKVLSSAWLSNDEGLSVRVGIPHIKLDSAGLVEGAYARITGTYAVSDEEFGTPLVTVDRRSLQADAEHSWEDWARFQLRRVFTPIPHGLAMAWSWERGLDGANNQLRYGTWLPFHREVPRG